MNRLGIFITVLLALFAANASSKDWSTIRFGATTSDAPFQPYTVTWLDSGS